MRLGLNIGYSGSSMADQRPLVEAADRIGVDTVWSAEAYGSDAVTVLSYLAACTDDIQLGSAILQIPGRTPANTAMTAMTLDHLSQGRFILGLGVSGPQVVEGWHGVPYGKPLAKTREYVDIVRTAIAREEPLEHHGEHYDIPYRGDDATGQGKPLKSILHPLRQRIPIYLAAIGPKNIQQTVEIAEGWLPIFYSPYREEIVGEYVEKGLTDRDPALGDLQIAASVMVVPGDDVQGCMDFVRPLLALYVGGMGSRETNFYNELAKRYGFEEAAETIQDLYLDGKKDEAAAAVPDAMVDEVALVGPRERIAERLQPWRDSRVTELVTMGGDPDTLEFLREEL